VVLEDILIPNCAEIVRTGSDLFVETKNQDSLGKVDVLKNGPVSRGSVGNGINQLETCDAGKFNLDTRGELFFESWREPGLLQAHFETLYCKPIGLSDVGRLAKNVILFIKKCKSNVQFSQTIQGQEPRDRVGHEVGAEIEGPLKQREKVKVDGLSGKDVCCVVFPSLRCYFPVAALLRKTIGWVSLLRTEISLGIRTHVIIEHRVKIGTHKSLLVGAGNALVVVKHVHRFDEHFQPIVLQQYPGDIVGPGWTPHSSRISSLDLESSLHDKFCHGAKENRFDGGKLKINLSRRLFSVQVYLVQRIHLNVFGAQEVLIANILPRHSEFFGGG